MRRRQEREQLLTNPPFSLIRDYVLLLVEHDKKFRHRRESERDHTYIEIFELLTANKIWLGHRSGDMAIRVPDHYPPRDTRCWIDETGQLVRSPCNSSGMTNGSEGGGAAGLGYLVVGLLSLVVGAYAVDNRVEAEMFFYLGLVLLGFAGFCLIVGGVVRGRRSVRG